MMHGGSGPDLLTVERFVRCTTVRSGLRSGIVGRLVGGSAA